MENVLIKKESNSHYFAVKVKDSYLHLPYEDEENSSVLECFLMDKNTKELISIQSAIYFNKGEKSFQMEAIAMRLNHLIEAVHLSELADITLTSRCSGIHEFIRRDLKATLDAITITIKRSVYL